MYVSVKSDRPCTEKQVRALLLSLPHQKLQNNVICLMLYDRWYGLGVGGKCYSKYLNPLARLGNREENIPKEIWKGSFRIIAQSPQQTLYHNVCLLLISWLWNYFASTAWCYSGPHKPRKAFYPMQLKTCLPTTIWAKIKSCLIWSWLLSPQSKEGTIRWKVFPSKGHKIQQTDLPPHTWIPRTCLGCNRSVNKHSAIALILHEHLHFALFYINKVYCCNMWRQTKTRPDQIATSPSSACMIALPLQHQTLMLSW